MIYTLGYAGWSLAALVDQVRALGAQLVDVRFQPWSRNPNFTSQALRDALGESYTQVRDLGNENFKGGPIQLHDPEAAVPLIKAMLQVRPVILLCACADVTRCHRTVAAEFLAARLGVEVIHLEPSACENPRILGVTLHGPWPWAFTLDHPLRKDIENRTWAPPVGHVGKHLALHVGQTWDAAGARWIADLLAQRGCDMVVPTKPSYQTGVIVGTARLVGVLHRTKEQVRVVAGDETKVMGHATSPWFFGPYGWVLDEVVAIPSVVCRGAQKLWELPPGVLKEVRRGWVASQKERDSGSS